MNRVLQVNKLILKNITNFTDNQRSDLFLSESLSCLLLIGICQVSKLPLALWNRVSRGIFPSIIISVIVIRYRVSPAISWDDDIV